MPDICGICIETYNKRARRIIRCPCGFECCKSCFKSYLLSVNDPICMSPKCHIEFDMTFLYLNMDKKFLRTIYKNHVKNTLLNKSQRILNIAKMEIDISKKREELHDKIECKNFRKTIINILISKINSVLQDYRIFSYKCPRINEKKGSTCGYKLSKVNGLHCKKCDMYICYDIFYTNCITLPPIYNMEDVINLSKLTYKDFDLTSLSPKYDIQAVHLIFNKLMHCLCLISLKIEQVYINDQKIDLFIEINNMRSEKTSIQVCPNELCNGFLDIDFRCQLCKIAACPKCESIKGSDHECNNDIIKSLQLIKTEYDPKPCPVCFISISKVDGCDNMWCSNCRAFFNWNTNKIISGVVENPEYTDYIRGHRSRDPNDVICGREIDLIFGYDLMENYHNLHILNCSICSTSKDNTIQLYPFVDSVDICNTCEQINAISTIVLEIPFLKTTINDLFHIKNLDTNLYKSYLLNIITIDKFKEKIYSNFINDKMDNDILVVISCFITTLTELIYRLQEDLLDKLDDILYEIYNAIDLVNTDLSNISKIYNTPNRTYLITKQCSLLDY